MESYSLLIKILILSILFWVVSHTYERRRILNGVFFGMALGSVWILLVLITFQYEYRFLQILLGLSAMGIILVLIFAFMFFVVSLFTSGIRLIKREGLSLAHALSLTFGLAIVVSSFVLPTFYPKIHSRFIKAAMLFFSSYFAYFSLVFIIYASSAFIYHLYYEKRNKDFLIVLGAGLRGEEVTPLLASRIDKAIKFYHSQIDKGQKPPRIIMSGGQGPDEVISEAEAMKRYAVKQGIPKEHVLKEDRSTSTKENLLFSSEIIHTYSIKDPKVLFFTNNFHVFRASLLAKNLGLSYQGQGSKTKYYFFISAFIREYIAYLFMNPKRHIVLSTIYALVHTLVFTN